MSVGLTDCNEVPAVSRWVSSGTMFMSGKSFIDAVKVRTGSLYTPADASSTSFRSRARSCRGAACAFSADGAPRPVRRRSEASGEGDRLFAGRCYSPGLQFSWCVPKLACDGLGLSRASSSVISAIVAVVGIWDLRRRCFSGIVSSAITCSFRTLIK